MIFQGYALVLLAAVCWGGIGPFSKLAFSAGLTPLEVAFWRAALGWIFFASHALIIRRIAVKLKDLPMLFFFGLWGVSLFYGVYLFAVQAGGAALAAVLLYTAPAWVALLSRFFLAESLTPVKLACVGLTMLGVAGVAFGKSNGGIAAFDVLGVLCGLLSGFLYAMYYIFGKRVLSVYSTPTIFLYALPVGALSLLPFVHLSLPTTTGFLAVSVLAVVSTYGAYSIYYLGLKHLEATKAAVVATLEPLVAGLMAYLWWDERLSLYGYLGGGLILAGVVLLIVKDQSKKPMAKRSEE